MGSGNPSTSEKRQFVRRLFSTIAPRYDWFNRLASCGLDQGWRVRTIAETNLSAGMRVLDVCTGTGDLAFFSEARVGPSGLVVGLDLTRPMLEAAARKPQGRAGRLRWIQGDAQQLPFPAAAFDRVMIGFSTRNLTDLRQGCAEMLRVLNPTGQLAILETGRPAHPVVRAGYFLFLHTVVRAIGVILTGRAWPFTYLAKSVKGFLKPDEVVALLETCGATARHVPLSGGLASLYLARKCQK